MGVQSPPESRTKQVKRAVSNAYSWLTTMLENVPVAAYTCDCEGRITYFNPPAASVWGRTPKLDDPKERYCGSHRLFWSDAKPMSHDTCWMARALQEKREYNRCEVMIEQPGGKRIIGLAYANPIYDKAGKFQGGLNLLLPNESRPAPERSASLGTTRIVVVGTQSEIADLALVLNAMRFSLKTAATGVEAIQMAKAFRPQLMVVSTELPQMDGYEVARMIRRASWGQHIVLVALNHDGSHGTTQARAAGFDQELKGVNVPAILSVIASLPK